MKVEDKTHEFRIETLIPDYFNPDALKTEPRPIYRLDIADDRTYYTLAENGQPVFYQSVTSVIKRALPTSPFLIKWMMQKGEEGAAAYRDERAAFGTFMHSLFAKILIDRQLDLNSIHEKLNNYLELNRYPANWIKWEFEMKSACMAFAKWVIDYEVKPIAIELALASDKIGIAGMIDLPCELTVTEEADIPETVEKREVGFFGETYKRDGKDYKAGDPKQSSRIVTETVMKRKKVKVRRKAIVDFKSGNNFYEEHEIQLIAYREIWNENFPEDQLHYLFNWSPKDWRGTVPTYNFKDQTNSKRLAKLWPIIELAKIERGAQERVLTILDGSIDIDAQSIGNIREVDYVTAILGEKDERPEPVIETETESVSHPTLFDELAGEGGING